MRPAPSKNFAAFLAAINSDRVFLLDDAGTIYPLTWDQYEDLPVTDPRLRHVEMTSDRAERASNRLRGLRDLPEFLRN
jgi:hypothetical protein